MNIFLRQKGGRMHSDILFSGHIYWPVVLARFFTRNRRNKFCPACQHRDLCHCLSFSIRSMNNFIRMFCSRTSMRIRENKTKQVYNRSLPFQHTYMYVQKCGYLLFFFKYLEKNPLFFFFPCTQQHFCNILPGCMIYQKLKRIMLSDFRLTTDHICDYLPCYTTTHTCTLWVQQLKTPNLQRSNSTPKSIAGGIETLSHGVSGVQKQRMWPSDELKQMEITHM